MIRKLLTVFEETREEAGQRLQSPTRKVAAVAVIWNPYVGSQADELPELIDFGETLGDLLGRRAVEALGVAPADVQSYGKAAIVGADGELEHAAAVLHPKLDTSLRRAVERGAALVPSATKRGGLGTSIDVPLGHKKAALVRSHFDAFEIRVPDAPRRDEIVVVVALADSGRPMPRIGGLAVADIEGKDGLY